MKGIRLIIFDWGRTLYNNEGERLFEESHAVLTHCVTKGYRVALLSVSSDPTRFSAKEKLIEDLHMKPFFEKMVIATQKEKEEIDEIAHHFGIPYSSILMIGDRTVREIKIANELGMQSIWIQKGKFAHEIPTPETGKPTHTVNSLREVINLI
mgnify:CR=1 FL=1